MFAHRIEFLPRKPTRKRPMRNSTRYIVAFTLVSGSPDRQTTTETCFRN